VHGDVESVDAVATWDHEAGTGAVFVVNRNPDQGMDLTIDLSRLGSIRLKAVTTLAEDDPYACNSVSDPDRVKPRDRRDATLEEGMLHLRLPAVSWSTMSLER
jgi:alpha-N-arabinofuranosidase